jgi:hypothetical protein
MDLYISSCLRSAPALRLLATSALGLYCAVAMAGAQSDIRPLLEAAPSVDFVYLQDAGTVGDDAVRGGRC